MESSRTPVIELLPEQGPSRQLFVMLHGVGLTASSMLPLAVTLRHYFPAAAMLLPEAPHAFDSGLHGRQWFSRSGLNDGNRHERVSRALPALAELIRRSQDRLKLLPPDTALIGFSQGAVMALELSAAYDGLAGRVLSFSGRYARLPDKAPELTTLHFFHGQADTVIPAAFSNAAYEHLAARQADATLDLASGVGHEIHPALIERAVSRLQTCIPLRTWRRAL